MAETTNKDLTAKLLEVQSELSKQKLKKDGKNPFHGSTYVSLEKLLDFVLPVLNKNGILLTQWVSHYEGHPSLLTRLTDGDKFQESTMLLMLKSEDPQAQGSAITYARRYALMSALGLVGAEDDDDGQAATNASSRPSASKPNTAAPTKEYPASEAQIKLMRTTIGRKGFSPIQADQILCSMAEVEKPENITKRQASDLINRLFSISEDELFEHLPPAEDQPDRSSMPVDDLPPPDDIEIREVTDND